MAEQNSHTLICTASVKGYFRVRDVIDEQARLPWWQRSPRLRAVANRPDGRLIESGPATMVKDLASMRVFLFRQNTRLGASCRLPPFNESGRNPGELMLKFWLATWSPPWGPGDSSTVAAPVGDRLAQRPRLYLLDEPDGCFTVPAGNVQLEPMTELNFGKVLLREQHGHTLSCPAADNDHLGSRSGAQEAIVRNWIPRLRTVANGIDGHTGKPCLPRLRNESKGLGIITLGQQLRFAARRRYPSLAEGSFNLGALPLESELAIYL